MTPTDGAIAGQPKEDASMSKNTITNGSGNGNGNANSTAVPLKHRRVTQTASPAPSMDRQAGSFSSYRTDSSSPLTRPFSVRSTTDDLLSPRATTEHGDLHQDDSFWYSVPLLFAIVPAIGGLAFKSGSVLLTDFSLLILAAIYLNWCLVTPWVWYQAARSVSTAKSSSPKVAVEDPIEDDDFTGDGVTTEQKKSNGDSSGDRPPHSTTDPTDSNAAANELRIHELTALILCFIGPPLGSYVLHIIRGSLSQVGDQLVSNLHLSLFVLGAEIRPLRHAVKLVQGRTLYLQRVIREDPEREEGMDVDVAQDLSKRLHELEAAIADPASKIAPAPTSLAPDSSDQFKKVHSTLQTQIDALNRAVRRYEKRATAQTLQTEARLQDLETRLREALALAAAAATYSQKPGLVAVMLQWFSSLFLLPLRAMRASLMYPFLIVHNFTTDIMVKFGLATDGRERRITKQPIYPKSSRDSYFSRKTKRSD